MTRAASPADTIFDARPPNVTSARLDVLWGSASIGTDVTVTAGYITPVGWVYESVDSNTQKARHEFTHLQKNLASTGTVDVSLEYGAYNEYRRLFVYTFNSAGALNNSQIDNLSVKSLSYSWANIPSEILQGLNANQYSISPLTGVYIIDLTTDGRMTERLNARSLSELVLRLNSLVSNGTVEVVSEKFISA